MPSGELLAPLNRVLFPAFVRVKHNAEELSRVFLLAIGIQALIAFPASTGLAVIGEQAVVVLLGEQWLFVVPFLQILALAYVVQAIAISADHLMITVGEIRLAALISWSGVTMFALLAGLAIWGLPDAGATEIALIRLFSTLVTLAMTFWILKRVVPNIRLPSILRSVIRPLFGVSAMALALIEISNSFDLSPFMWLLVKIPVGAFVYTFAIGVAWVLMGKPEGGERYLLARVTEVFNRFRGGTP